MPWLQNPRIYGLQFCASSSAKRRSHSCRNVSLFGLKCRFFAPAWTRKGAARSGCQDGPLGPPKRLGLDGPEHGGHAQGGRGIRNSGAVSGRLCRLPPHLLLVLAQMIHVEIGHDLERVLVHLDSERAYEPEAALRVCEDADHIGAPLDLLV